MRRQRLVQRDYDEYMDEFLRQEVGHLIFYLGEFVPMGGKDVSKNFKEQVEREKNRLMVENKLSAKEVNNLRVVQRFKFD